MIPVLHRADERTFNSNGIGRLTDCVSCIVTEERNGIYELELKYPITGKLYQEMCVNGGIIGAIHDDRHDIQLFDIYAHTDPIDGIVTFNAHHISYRLANVILQPFSGTSVGDTFSKIPLNTINTCPFMFWTNKTTSGDFELTKPDNVRAILGGQEGSILDVFGSGDYEFDNFDVKLYANRGFDTGVTIRYGKNMSSIENKEDDSSSYSAIVPYWVGSDGVTVYGGMVVSPTIRAKTFPWTDERMFNIEDGNGEVIEFRSAIITPRAVDFSSDFQEQPTPAQLEERATQYMVANETWEMYRNIKVDFVQLWQTPEYANVASLQRVSLCDLVSVYFPEMGIIQNKQKVIRVDYNVLLERYDSIELGQAQTTLSEMFENGANEVIKEESQTIRNIIKRQTELITGGLGGHVVMTLNADGQPQEILIMDTDDIETAVNVIRMNRNGIGFSRNGYSGPFTSAWTIDGKFNADFISAGTLLANYIRGGTLTIGGVSDSYGQITVLDQNGNTVGKWTNAGINTGQFRADFPNGYLSVGTGGLRIMTGNAQQNPTYIDIDPGYGWQMSKQTSSYLYESYLLAGEVGASIYSYSTGTSPSYFQYSYQDGQTFHTDVRGGLRSDTLSVTGTKSRSVGTDEYGQRLLYCYETPTPTFGDIGEAVLDDTGLCYVFLDAIFAETVSTSQYQVFLQKYGDGDCFISERHAGYFVVQGTPGLSFGWELKAKQSGYDQIRLERDEVQPEPETHDYGAEAADFYEKLMEEREAA